MGSWYWSITMSKELFQQVVSTNALYREHKDNWQYLLESYVGGKMYRDANHLTKYILEAPEEYNARLKSTYLPNECQSVVGVYTSFLFREEPERIFGSISTAPETAAFLQDADLDGRSFDNFMKEISIWSSVYGHTWILVVKPNTNASTRADELAQEVRPYVSMLSPLSVLDWRYSRQPNGLYVLTYLKYVEETTEHTQSIKEWTQDTITTYVTNLDNETVSESETVIEVNGLGKIPAIISYNKRSFEKGIGVSDIEDIANAQRFIYNCNSEIEQSVRLESHPSLVKTADTDAGIGAGSLIHMPEGMDPGLKPYVLDFDGASVASILQTIATVTESIDKMANTGSVRAVESKSMSGVAMETEFQLLNARLSEKADNLELTEEQIWRLFSLYLGRAWNGEIDYPSSFNIRDTHNEFAQLQSARAASDDPRVIQVINERIMDLLGEDPETLRSTVVIPTDQV